MTILSFRSKKDKEKLYEKAKKMEEFAADIVECLEEAMYDGEEDDYEYSERMYRGGTSAMRGGRYGYRVKN